MDTFVKFSCTPVIPYFTSLIHIDTLIILLNLIHEICNSFLCSAPVLDEPLVIVRTVQLSFILSVFFSFSYNVLFFQAVYLSMVLMLK